MSMADCNTTCSAAERLSRRMRIGEFRIEYWSDLSSSQKPLFGENACMNSSETHLNLQGDFAIVGRINWSECALQVQRLSKKRRCEISVWRCEVRMIERIDRVHAQCQMIFL